MTTPMVPVIPEPVVRRIRSRRDTAANWASRNPVLGEGEIAFELRATPQDLRSKVGDGETAWNDLPYQPSVTDQAANATGLAALPGLYGATRTAVKTSAYSAAAGDLIPVDTTSSPVTITIPAGLPDGSQIAVKHILQGGTNTVTVALTTGEVLNKTGGSTSVTLSLLNQGVVLKKAGTIWTVISDDLPLSLLTASFAPAKVCAVTGDGTTDDAAGILANLTAGAGRVIVPRGSTGVIMVGSMIVIPSGVTLELAPGVTLRRKSTLVGNFIQNAGVASGTRDTNVGITLGVGSTIDAGTPAAGTTGYNLHAIRLRKIDGLTISGAGATSLISTSGGKYAVNISDVTNYQISDFALSGFSDGIHINGPTFRGRVANLYGTTSDDFVAITPRDWTAYDDNGGGDVTDLDIENLYGTSTVGCALKILGGCASPLLSSKRITARNIFGAGTNNAIFIGDDTAQSNTTGGLLDDIVVENVHATAPNTAGIVWINGSNIKHLRVSDVHFDNSSATAAAVRISSATPITLGTVILTGINVRQMAASPVVQVDANVTISRLIMDRFTVASTTSGATCLLNSGVIADLQVRGVEVNFTGSSYVVSLNGAVAGATVNRLVMVGIHVVGTGGGLLTASASTHTLPSIDLTAVTVTGTAWLLDLNTVTAVNMSSVTHKSVTSGIANIRASGNVTFRGDGMNLASGNLAITAGGAAHSFSLGFPCDISKLTRDANGLATNTNAALACGAGPVVGNGTLWKHLYTGTTY